VTDEPVTPEIKALNRALAGPGGPVNAVFGADLRLEASYVEDQSQAADRGRGGWDNQEQEGEQPGIAISAIHQAFDSAHDKQPKRGDD